MFAAGGASSLLIVVGLAELPVDDYSTWTTLTRAAEWVGEIALAVAVLVIVGAYVLRVPWAAAGAPTRCARAWPAL